MSKTVYFLPLFEQKGKSDVGVRLYALMMLAADCGGEGHFGRTGVYNLVLNVENHRELMGRLLEEPGAFLHEGIYEEVLELDENGMGQYVISTL